MAKQELVKWKLAKQELVKWKLAKQELIKRELAKQELVKYELEKKKSIWSNGSWKKPRTGQMGAAKKTVIGQMRV